MKDERTAKADVGHALWNGNGIQFALGTDGSGLTGEQVEFRVTEKDKGVVFSKELAPYIGGDLPMRWTSPGEPVKYGEAAVEHLPGGKTIYRVRLDWNEFYPFSRKKGQGIPFAIAVNFQMAQGESARLEWGSGIVGIENPALYGELQVKGEKSEKVK